MGAVYGDIVSGIGAATGLFDSYTKADAARENVQLQRETNQLNYQMHREDQDFAVDMFNRTNEYNSPEQQAARLRAAGINPSAVLGANRNGGSVAAVSPSVPAGAPMVAPHVEPVSLSPSFKQYTDSIYQNLQSRNIDLNNQMEYFKLLHQDEQWNMDKRYRLAEIEDKLADKSLTLAQRDNYVKQKERIEQDIALHDEIRSDLVRRYRLDNNKVEADTDMIRTQTAKERLDIQYQDMVNKSFPALNDAQRKLLSSQASSALASAYQSYQSGHLSKKQKELVAVQVLAETLQNGIRANQFRESDIGLSMKELDALIHSVEGSYNLDALKNTPAYHKITKWLGDGLSNVVPILKLFK